ncbi:MFS family permease [Nocardioides salarius]|uniref:MFS family permease n=1 Tax=Nocardioides salarius TaxID=374513 RepID=A0ABS2MCI5_9ACTN|nr:MFS transporter [Nocardioides salarius]MBM7508916.1 MFS family permease [Nocardioides salarius]
MSSTAELGRIETKVPARMDRLPWSRFHWRVVFGLGLVWILDGLEVTMVGNVAARLTEDGSGIDIGAGQIGLAAAIYIVGATLGALFFGQLTDRWGRKKLFLITLAVYIVATVATAFATTPLFFYVTRFFTGAGIGGEYAAINSAIDELIPARVRGRVDLTINGSYWLGSAAGSALALVLLNTSIFAADLGWRLAFGLGAVLGLTILVVRRHVPESPRWLFIHGQEDEAERIVGDIEDDVREETGQELEEPEDTLVVRQRKAIPFREIAKVAFTRYPKRAVLGLALFVGQAFIYNGVTFNLGTLLNGFYDVSSGMVPLFVIVWALANFAGPVTLGRLFDTVGRKPMIAGTYLGSAVVAVVLGLYLTGTEGNRWVFLAILAAAFFLASSGASAAYLTVSEIFPMETRALAIAFFYAVGTAVGGITGPLLFGRLIESGDRSLVALAFYIGAGVMAIGGLVELAFGVKAEKSDLESLAAPLTSDEETDFGEESADDGSEDDGDREDPGAVERRERDARIRDRRARQLAGSTGSRRYRPGPGRGVGSPWLPPAPDEPSERALDSEIELISAAMAEHEEMAVADLADAVNARFWGPGRFPRALRVAADEGRVVRVSRGRVRAPDRVAAR